MGHATIEELLNLRDGAAVDATTDAHVAACGECRTELARLHALRAGLRALPPLPPAPESWARVVARVEPPVQLIARRSRMQVAVAGLAASFAIAVALGAVLLQVPATLSTDGTLATATRSDPTLEELRGRSQRLESVLAAVAAAPRVTSARSAGAIAELEDGIALVDYQLAQLDQSDLDAATRRALWRKRVELMESLVTVRYAGERADSI
jgi:tetrahydromethanopterin S-methyltransferase subunit F